MKNISSVVGQLYNIHHSGPPSRSPSDYTQITIITPSSFLLASSTCSPLNRHTASSNSHYSSSSHVISASLQCKPQSASAHSNSLLIVSPFPLQLIPSHPLQFSWLYYTYTPTYFLPQFTPSTFIIYHTASSRLLK